MRTSVSLPVWTKSTLIAPIWGISRRMRCFPADFSMKTSTTSLTLPSEFLAMAVWNPGSTSFTEFSGVQEVNLLESSATMLFNCEIPRE